MRKLLKKCIPDLIKAAKVNIDVTDDFLYEKIDIPHDNGEKFSYAVSMLAKKDGKVYNVYMRCFYGYQRCK